MEFDQYLSKITKNKIHINIINSIQPTPFPVLILSNHIILIKLNFWIDQNKYQQDKSNQLTQFPFLVSNYWIYSNKSNPSNETIPCIRFLVTVLVYSVPIPHLYVLVICPVKLNLKLKPSNHKIEPKPITSSSLFTAYALV